VVYLKRNDTEGGEKMVAALGVKCPIHGEFPNARRVCPICDKDSKRNHHNKRGLEIKRTKNMPPPSGSRQKKWSFGDGKAGKK